MSNYIENPNAVLLNLSYVGKKGKIDRDGIIIPPQKIEIFARFNRFGHGFVGVKYPGINTRNLKQGERKQLQRTNLTPHARRMIQGAGDFFEWKVNNGADSSIMLTLTYRRNIPPDKVAKQQLHDLIRNLKYYGHFKYYAWVAQLQTGERAIAKGKKSYRADHGSAIHFHILTEQIPADLVREHWVRIVNKWEIKSGYNPSVMSGVNIVTVYNASHYISRYISNENKSGNIIGNLWGISKELRKEINVKDTEVNINTTDLDWKDWVRNFKIESKNHLVRDTTFYWELYSCRDWNNLPLIFTKDVKRTLVEFNKYLRNQININSRTWMIEPYGQ